jgi:hypothetical protein
MSFTTICKDGNSLKKCDLPDSSYGKFKGAAGLKSGSLVVGKKETEPNFAPDAIKLIC